MVQGGWKLGAILLGMTVLLSGCEVCQDLNCEVGGGGGSTGELQFQRGLVFVHAGGNLGAADQSDWETLGTFTEGGGVRHPSVSPDGDTLIFATNDGSTLFSVPAAGGTLNTLLTTGGALNGIAEPVFDPNGERIVFTALSGGVTRIAQVRPDGTGQAELLSASAGGTAFSSPSFDASGRLYVVAGNGHLGAVELGRMDSQDGSYTPLANLTNTDARQVANRAEVSPDGTRIAFDGRVASGATRLFVLDIAGGTVVQLDVGQGNQGFPTWVSNSQLAFASDSGGAEQIYLVDADGGSPELIIPSASQPRFGPR